MWGFPPFSASSCLPLFGPDGQDKQTGTSAFSKLLYHKARPRTRGVRGSLQKNMGPSLRTASWIASEACKPSSVWNDHLSRPAVAGRFQRNPQSMTGRHMRSIVSCTGWGLHSGQVAKPLVSSYLAFPSLHAKRAVSLCCTFLGVASTGCYPAPCPMELGLSSCLRTRSFSFLATFESIAHGGDACQGHDAHLPPRIRPAGHCVMMMRPQFSHSTAALPERTCPSTAAGRDMLHPPQRSPCRRVIGGMLCFLMTL